MQPHHQAWLEDHPQYDREWLAQALAAGFDVHHLDSDHENNDPENLVLIEHSDHMKVHALEDLRRAEIDRVAESFHVRRTKSQRAYEMKAADPLGVTWAEVDAALGIKRAISYAKWWAQAHGLDWPLVGQRSHEMVKRRKALERT